MIEFHTEDPSFQKAFQRTELSSERMRVEALLGVLGGLLALILIRGALSLADGRRGEAWPYAAVLIVMGLYELAWLRVVTSAIGSGERVSGSQWRIKVFVESLIPTVLLLLQVHTSTIGPHRALTSPVVLAYFVFIILSTLHLTPALSRLCGAFSALGYAVVASYVFWRFPEVADREELLVYGTSLSCVVVLILGGFAGGAVAGQIRRHVIDALREAKSRAKVEQDLDVARSIQKGLLPKAPPKIDGFDIAGWNCPADQTGGDYFDWQPLFDGRIAISIADVTGHGIGPALCMASCRAYARAALAEGPDLCDFMGAINQLLYEDLPSEKFVTMAAAMLDPEEATMELISAGHGPLLFYLSAEDRFRSYDAQGLPLGIVPQFQYASPQTLTFSPGDIMVFVTDGLIEWSNAQDEEFGQGRLKAIIHSHRRMPAQAIISKLHEAVLKFAGTKPQADDLTVVIVKRKEGPRGPSLIVRDSRSFHRSRESTMSQIRFRYRYNEGAGGRGPRRRAAKLDQRR